MSIGAGLVGVIPFVIAGYVFQQYVLVAVGWATSDPTFDEGLMVSLTAGVVAPGIVLAVWGLVVRLRVRESDSRAALWAGGGGLPAVAVGGFSWRRNHEKGES